MRLIWGHHVVRTVDLTLDRDQASLQEVVRVVQVDVGAAHLRGKRIFVEIVILERSRIIAQ